MMALKSSFLYICKPQKHFSLGEIVTIRLCELLVSIVFLYFAQWIVIEKGLSDLSFNLTFYSCDYILICTAPFLG